MTNLRDHLAKARPRTIPKSFETFYLSLSEEEKKDAWDALQDPDFKTYTLLSIFREVGLREGKDSFVDLRKKILAGDVTWGDLNG